MNVITVRRTVFHGMPNEPSVKRIVINGRFEKTPSATRSLRDLTHAYFRNENSREFVIEALFFVIIAVISAWPILGAASALHEFFQRALT
jgi:hypothetical protein